jgi:hypothetical protein
MQEKGPYIMWFLDVFEVGLIKISVPIISLKFLFFWRLMYSSKEFCFISFSIRSEMSQAITFPIFYSRGARFETLTPAIMTKNCHVFFFSIPLGTSWYNTFNWPQQFPSRSFLICYSLSTNHSTLCIQLPTVSVKRL